ncbi:putative pre-16S rRNA nuclease [Pseudoclavibacter endophyticus]|uniref:Putative pre-16S rRNA nuclease n=1 Tax=Pseudoclavibacter endophyticus TaxID=1778590 RepID=A0A6H9WMG0_9MICO|nr:Holliday junction resolvase RuvX [Pseudoclavibacter endophyticus]KAB1650076.1 Holliday junction resolvase RuvX [Pseudoclavibacter endophyticus]GGA57480.1 putative pre-16S rRNA nuclease [Pseudoclavibacter endophyticus]
MRTGTRLGIDVGKARIGVARSDPHGLIATPIETVARDRGGGVHVAAIAAHARESKAVEVLVGLPIALSGNETASTQDARDVAQEIAAAVDIPVRLVDERLTTVTATRQLREVGRKASTSRDRIDQLAAVVLLQNALDGERSTGSPPGTLVTGKDDHA